MTRKEITRAIRALKQSMQADGIRIISCFNGGLTRAESQANLELFQLKCLLDKTPV